ncbi:MAG: globin [Sulfurovum sp.]|nr:globin [Sulfurovum sp.]
MPLDITPVKKGEAIHFHNPNKKFYEAVGGEEGIKKLMYSFYDKIYESDIAHFFPQDEDEFEAIKVQNTKFFVQICGGPKVYENETRGMELNEYMIRLHDDFSVTEKSRVEWLGTMREALNELEEVEQSLIDDFWEYLDSFSKLTVNSFSDGSTYFAAFTQAKEDR